MYTIRKLSKSDLDILYKKYPFGRPLRFECSSQSGGFSLITTFINLYRKACVVERVPEWVCVRCKEVQQQLISAAMLLLWVQTEIILGGPPLRTIKKEGTLISINRKDDDTRIAILFGSYKRFDAWLVAAWNSKTEEEEDLPDFGEVIKVPISYDMTVASEIKQRAENVVLEEMSNIKERDDKQAKAIALLAIIVTFVVVIFDILSNW